MFTSENAPQKKCRHSAQPGKKGGKSAIKTFAMFFFFSVLSEQPRSHL